MSARAAVLLLAVAFGGCATRTAPAPPVEARDALHDLSAIQELAAAFDRDRGHPRVVLLLSPT